MDAPWVSILTPPEPGAIGVLHVQAPDAASLEAIARQAGIPLPHSGGVRVGSIAGVDHGVVIRWTDTTLHLTPHAGPAIIRAIVGRLAEIGVCLAPAEDPDACTLYPEAADEIEARMLAALARAASPLAIDLLLDQARRWRTPGAASDPARDRVLNRLLDPPLVAAVGPPNIGKSTLCNALAGRSVAIVADEAGTTRDHVGVLIDVHGLVVRYLDTPGLGTGSLLARADAPPEEAAAVDITRRALHAADLILRCADATAPPLDFAPDIAPHAATLSLALRTDLAWPSFPHDHAVSAARGQGIDALAAA
ncbi:MAG: 50S ribosome-binding GTPase, partial [Phycisphaerales bacterium]|nr:50S ribosome-binding GTPase [Phycisphaerales bacterium]